MQNTTERIELVNKTAEKIMILLAEGNLDLYTATQVLSRVKETLFFSPVICEANNVVSEMKEDTKDG